MARFNSSTPTLYVRHGKAKVLVFRRHKFNTDVLPADERKEAEAILRRTRGVVEVGEDFVTPIGPVVPEAGPIAWNTALDSLNSEKAGKLAEDYGVAWNDAVTAWSSAGLSIRSPNRKLSGDELADAVAVLGRAVGLED